MTHYLTLVAIAPDVHGQTAVLQGGCHFILPLDVVHVCRRNSINSHNLIVHTQLAKLRWTAWGGRDRRQGNEER